MIHHTQQVFVLGRWDDGTIDELVPSKVWTGHSKAVFGEIGWEEENELTNIALGNIDGWKTIFIFPVEMLPL